MNLTPSILERVKAAVRRDRLLQTAVDLVAVPSRTGEAGRAADALEAVLKRDGFQVERRAAGHPAAPAVIARLDTGRAGPTLQWNGHLDTVHLPFVPPVVEGDLLAGSGASDMKGGLAAAVEALRALRDSGALERGAILFTAHDLHEAPWGFGEQLDRLIRDGVAGDAALIPEPLCDRLPVIGRGAATWKATIRRPGPPIHEVMRPVGEPSVIAAGAELVARLAKLDAALSERSDPLAGSPSVFVGQIHSGEIYNQYPQECRVEGTRRFLPVGAGVPHPHAGEPREEVERQFRELASALARDTRTQVDLDFRFIRDAFLLDQESTLVTAFLQAHELVSGRTLPVGPKPFVDDGNSFWALARVPAITHGPRAGGQHTVDEWVSIDDLVRVARVYALTAVEYCGGPAR